MTETLVGRHQRDQKLKLKSYLLLETLTFGTLTVIEKPLEAVNPNVSVTTALNE
jgi:hypothetical protein